ISVVIPVLNEEKRILAQLEAVRDTPGLDEILVVDGGSHDRTVEIARDCRWTRVLAAPCGRATQMNAGACAAAGDVLLFLHADVRLPPRAAERIRESLAQPGVVAGAFRTWTVHDGETRRWLAP